ncbi:SDR family oxidoreductase [Pseudomonas sp. EpS/L25]|uniref:SDR family oxidoreductase n=1 Tax=Pseudomonas sp. EpS/L25 TaxID=1749078 RepID=UPI0007433609|nr:SDR family oxidoreductase [Pseudomonas sp. EpS/L25]KUM42509.1 short-chain dehydrogenase [Pseudomonas sp. EpS/L25]
MQLPDCRILLTGASGGIGLPLVEQLCTGGAQVLAVARDTGALQPLVERFGTRLRLQGADLTQRPDRQAVLAEASRGQGVNVLLNAAGSNSFALLEALDEDAIDAMLAVNIGAAIQLTRLLLPLLRRQPRAVVAHIGSTLGSIGYPGYAPYCASKFALRGFTQALRRELADTRIRVLYVAPRATRTAMNSPAAMALNQALKSPVDEPAVVASAVIRALVEDRQELYLGWPEKLFVRLNGLLPGLVDRALRRQLPVIRRFTDTPLVPEKRP